MQVPENEDEEKPVKTSVYMAKAEYWRMSAKARLQGLSFSKYVNMLILNPLRFLARHFTGEAALDFSDWEDEELVDLLETLEQAIAEVREEAERRGL